MVIGGIHGDEQPGVCLAQLLLKDLFTRKLSDFTARVIVIPVANPDGCSAHTRGNAHMIDINRNFPTKDFRKVYFQKGFHSGEKAASEPETKVILEVFSEYKPELIITFHAELGCVNYDGPAEEIAEAISAANGLPVCSDLGYLTPGSLGTYFGRERNLPVITLELLSEDQQWERHRLAILKTIGIVN